MKTVAAVVLACAFSVPGLAQAQDPAAPPPPPPPAADLAAPPSAVQAPPPVAAPVASPPPPMVMAQPYPSYGADESRPSTGVGHLVTGGIFTGVGVVDFLTAPICKTSLIPTEAAQNTCLTTSLISGGIFMAVGVPLLIVGGVKRSAYNAWKAQHPYAAGLGFSTGQGGGTLTFSGQF